MRKVLIALLLMALPMTAWSAVNLPNYSFESGFTSGVADGWYQFYADGGTPVTCSLNTDIENVHHGLQSQKIDALGGGKIGGVYTTVDTVVGEAYTFSVWVKATTGPSGDPWETSYLAIFKNGNTADANGMLPDGDDATEWIYNLHGFYLGNPGTWEQLSWTGPAINNRTTIALYVYKGGVSYFDEAMPSEVISPLTIGDVLNLAEDSSVALSAKRVIAGYPEMNGAFYIEEMDRSAGIQVVWTEEDMYAQDEVNVRGTLGTNAEGERIINATEVNYLTEGNELPEPLFLTGRDLGGADFGAYTKGVYQGKGLYNVGKLVTVFGKVTYRGTGFFYLDDGSALYDGNGVATAKGVRIDTTGLSNPTQNYAVVTGIATMKKIGDNSVRMVCPLSASDIIGY